MKSLLTILLLMICSCLVAAGQARPRGKKTVSAAPAFKCLDQITRNDWQMLVADIRKANPQTAKRLEEDPVLRKAQVKSLRELLAFGCGVVKEGVTKDPLILAELDNIRREIRAVEYDRAINGTKNGQFSLIGAERVTAFYAMPANLAKFEEFLKVKTQILKRNGSLPDREVTPEERQAAKDIFAKISIYDAEIPLKQRKLGPNFIAGVNLKYKLQQSQFLARMWSETVNKKVAVTDEEVAAFIAEHPEFGLAAKESKARSVLAMAKSGKDFAALANEYSEDPGNTGADGSKNGGLYANVPKGMMVTPFEHAALSLEPGKIYPEPVATAFGYHIIKLDGKTNSTGTDGKNELKYDVRHILISTMQKDPNDPNARDMPVNDFVRNRIAGDREKRYTEEVLAANPVVIAHPDAPLTPAKKKAVRRRK